MLGTTQGSADTEGNHKKSGHYFGSAVNVEAAVAIASAVWFGGALDFLFCRILNLYWYIAVAFIYA